MNCYCGSSHCLATDGHPIKKDLHPLELQIQKAQTKAKWALEDKQHLLDNPNGCRDSQCRCCGCGVCPPYDFVKDDE